MSNILFGRLALASLLLSVATAASAQDVRPLEVRNLRGLSVPFLRINPRGDVMGFGRTEWSVDFSAANSSRFLTEGAKFVSEDYEIDQMMVRYRTGIGKGYDFTAEIPFMGRGAGMLDPFISFWHDLVVNFKAPFRDSSPLGRSILKMPGHAQYGGASGIGDTNLAIAKQLNPNLEVIASAKLPTGDARGLLGSGAVDAGLSLQWHTRISHKLAFHASAGGVYQGKSNEIPEARKSIWQGSWSLVYQPNSTDTFIGQWQGEPSATVTGVSDSDGPHTTVSLAYRRKMADARWIEAYLCEDGDFLGYNYKWFVNNAPDLTLGIRFTQRF